MSLLLPSTLSLGHKPHRCFSSSSSSSSSFPSSTASFSASMGSDVKIMTEANTAVLCLEATKDRIRKLFDKVQLSVSSYDTAWVAMVPSPNSSQAPCFPQCIDWLLDNQLSDGSWGLPHHHPSLIKDALSSTLASLLALKRWGVGEEQIRKGLHFIELNITSASDENQHSPIGFDIIFPGMVEYAKDLQLNIPLRPTDLDSMLHRRELDLRRGYAEERKSYLAYVSEGMGKLQDWEMVMKYQRKNGSLFNSPSTTAAAFIHLQDAGCLNYLHSLLEKFENAVPTVYPLDIYARLCMVDSLERLGIERHFRKEIRSVLDEVYRCWLQREEEIFLDPATCAMAFRFLRLNGYDVSSDPLTQITRGKLEFSFSGGHLKDIGAALELYRASQIIIYPDESALEEQYSWSSHFLKQKLLNGTTHADRLIKSVTKEVNDALKFPFNAIIKRVESRRYIEHYNIDSTRILKTSFSSSNIRNEDFLKLAVEDFNTCQSVHRKELNYLERWVIENRLDTLKFARQKLAYCYFAAAATVFSPELSDARLSWAKNSYLTVVFDDFFDFEGSMEELENLSQLVEEWDVNVAVDCRSENVEILFSALHSTICEIGAKAFTFQGRHVTKHLIEIWLDVVNTMMREAKWARDNSVPTLDEYMPVAFISFALGPIILPTLYFLGPKLSEEVVYSSEYENLSNLMNACGRLLNDIRSFERESKQGKLNAVGLYMVHGGGGGAGTEEEAIGEVTSLLANYRRELLRVVLEEKGGLVPQACKDVFWNMSQVMHLFYMKDDGFTLHGMLKHVKAVIHEPIALSSHDEF